VKEGTFGIGAPRASHGSKKEVQETLRRPTEVPEETKRSTI